MKKGLEGIKSAIESLSKMVADYESGSMEESGESDCEMDAFDDEDAGEGGQDVETILPNPTGKDKKVNKVSIASAIIKKKMGL
jgi:hypothetical protein